MTVAVPNVDQMVIQGSRKYSHRGEGGQEKRIEKAKIKVEECKSKGTLGNMLPVCRDNTTKRKPHFEAAWKQKNLQVTLGSVWRTERGYIIK